MPDLFPVPKAPRAPELLSLEHLLGLRRLVHEVTFVPRRSPGPAGPSRATWFVVDQRCSMFCSTRSVTKASTAAELVAAGAWRAFDLEDRAGVVTFDDDRVSTVRPRRGWRNVMRILQAVQETHQRVAEGDLGRHRPAMLDSVLADLESAAGRGFLVVVLSDFDGAGETTRRRIGRLARRGEVIALPIYDPSSTQFLGRGRAGAPRSERHGAHRRIIDFAARQRGSTMPWAHELDVRVHPVAAGADRLGQMHRLLGRAVA